MSAMLVVALTRGGLVCVLVLNLLNNCYLHPLQELRAYYLAVRAKVLVMNSLFTMSVKYTSVSNRGMVEI